MNSKRDARAALAVDTEVLKTMAQEDWHYAGADAGGFVAFEVLQDSSSQLSQEQFLNDFPVPALLVVYRERDPLPGQDAPDTVTNPGVQLLTVSLKSTAILHYLNKIAFVCKRPGNLYSHLISVGRSNKNDISINVDSVSKVHGYFSREGDDWTFTDHDSTNGSMVNERELTPGEKYRLQDGDVLQLGLEVTMEFFLPPTLYERLRRR